MAKRKRTDPKGSSTSSDVLDRLEKILKPVDNAANQQRPKTRQNIEKVTAARNENMVEAQSTFTFDRATTPPELNYNQRKRWRKKQRQAGFVAQNAESNATGGPVDYRKDRRPSSSAIDRGEVNAPSRSLLEQVSRTALVRRPVKQWISTQEGSNRPSSPQAATRPESTPLRRLASDLSSPGKAERLIAAEFEGDLPQPSATRERPPSLHTDVECSNRTSIAQSALEEIETPRWKPTTHLLALRRPKVLHNGRTTESGSEPPRSEPPRSSGKPSPASPVSSRPPLSHIHMDYSNYGASVKPISSLKATSVPSYTGRGDAQSAFERFNKWANGVGDSSGGDSSSSDGDNDDRTLAATTRGGILPASIDDPTTNGVTPTCAEDRDSTRTGLLDSNDPSLLPIEAPLSTTPQVPGESEASYAPGSVASHAEGVTAAQPQVADDQANLSLSEEYISTRSPSGTPPLILGGDFPIDPLPHTEDQAVAIRETSEARSLATPLRTALIEDASDLPLFAHWIHEKENLSMEEGDPPFMHATKYGKDDTLLPADMPTFSSNLTDHEDQTDVFKDIDDVARGVFGATRALPFGKPPFFQDAAAAGHVTDDHSDVATMKKRSDKDKANEMAVSPLSVQVTRCTTPYIPMLEDLVLGSPSPYSKCFLGIGRRSPMVLICNSVRIDDIEIPPMDISAQNDVPSANRKAVPHRRTKNRDQESSSSELSELSQSPTPPDDASGILSTVAPRADGDEIAVPTRDVDSEAPTPSPTKKRKIIGITSRHFSRSPSKQAQTPVSKRREIPDRTVKTSKQDIDVSSSPSIYATPADAITYSSKRTRASRKSTAKSSALFTPAESPLSDADPEVATPLPRKRRVPAGTSTAPVPSIKESRFGLIQEKLWDQPFWLIIAVTFLNKTAGKAAAPIFWRLKELYPTPEALAEANEDDLVDMIYHLGLQTQRAKRLIKIAKAWSADPPVKGKRYRTFHYPVKGDGKEFRKNETIEEDSQDCAGALEIGHIPGCGPYAWDSWRIFSRDPLRSVAEDYNGTNPVSIEEGDVFVPEWQRVVPLDKELRACLRWMWLREGWIWNHETGERRAATNEEMQQAEKGEMRIEDAQERKFAEQAAGVEVEAGEEDPMIEAADAADKEEDEIRVKTSKRSRSKAFEAAGFQDGDTGEE